MSLARDLARALGPLALATALTVHPKARAAVSGRLLELETGS